MKAAQIIAGLLTGCLGVLLLVSRACYNVGG